MKDFIKENHKVIFVFLLTTVLYFYGSNKIPLLNRTDSRYAEIAREMVISGNYIVPKLMGTPHLHKPPLSYWFMALGMKIFGINEFGVRFFQIIFAILSLFIIYLIARELFDKEKAYWTLILSSTSPGIFFTSRILATDIFLFFFELTAFYFYLKFYKTKKEILLYLFWLSLGLGFMTKGPVAVVIPLLILVLISLFKLDFSEIKPLFRLKYLLTFSVIAFPWYLYLIFSDKKILEYFLIDQLYARIAGIKGTKIGHPKSVYYYFEILPILILPFYIPFLIAIIEKIRKGISNRDLFLITWFSFPLIFFSVILTKLPTYILFSIPPAAMLTADWIEETKSKLKCLWLTAGLIPFLFLLNTRYLNISSQINREIVKLSIITGILILFLSIIKFIKNKCFKALFFISWTILFIFIVKLFISYPQLLNSNKKLAYISKEFSHSGFTFVSFRQYAFQIPFYTHGETPYYCDIKIEKEISPFKKIISCKELKKLWDKENFLILVSKKDIINLTDLVKDCFVLAKDGNNFVISNKPLWGANINWKEGVKTHRLKAPVNLMQFVKVSFNNALTKAKQAIDKEYNLHDSELAIIKNRVYYEFEFVKRGDFFEVHVDAYTGNISIKEPVNEKAEFTEHDLKNLSNIEKGEARKIALNLIKGKILEEEIEIENGALCYAYHIEHNNNEYEILINVSNGLPFKISFEKQM
ncbi:glycosyltransferase family 39 protein [Thermotomaculum hydrothermale]|uniref:glycosyltransferase family 39 protein n=1 Tax=Thermotomaculum hydrothermale TaxID=981385 RepID=UPI0019162ECD|nr:glycosyltransferase family 39 protein [Thermotomaculum hydrothermale]